LVLAQEGSLIAFGFEVFELFIFFLALHFIDVIHDSQWDCVERVPVWSYQTVVEGELKLPPVKVFILLLVFDCSFREIGEIADVKIFKTLI
jgi:hypothetical protein